jgi:hypothetical protein
MNPMSMCMLIQLARHSIEGATIAAEGLASHGIIESLNFERLTDHLGAAQDAICKLDEALVDANAVETLQSRAANENIRD